MKFAAQTGTAVRPSAVHHEWTERLRASKIEQLRDDVASICSAAGRLGIWKHGGYVPLQPFIVDSQAQRNLHKISTSLQDLVVQHSLEDAGGELDRLAEIIEWPREDRWVLASGASLSDALGSRRADVFIAGGQPRFLEFNFGTCLNGSTSTPVLSSALLRTSVGREIVRNQDIVTKSYLAALVRWVGRHAISDSSRLAMLGLPEQGDEGSLRWFEEQILYMTENGIVCDFVPLQEADVVAGVLTWRGKQYGSAIRHFMAPSASNQTSLIAALEQAEGTTLFGSNISQLFTSKSLLADTYQDERLPPVQRELLRRYVPWTARLSSLARREGKLMDPVRWAEENRERAVIKPSNLFGSRGVVVGHLTSDAVWRDTLETAARGGSFIVQDLVRPDSWPNTYWHLDSESLVSVDAPVLLGPYSVDGTDGGGSTKQPIAGNEDSLLDPRQSSSLGCLMSA